MIAVRRACAEDCDAIWRIFQDEAAYAGTLQVPFPSREAWRKRVCEPPEGDYVLVAEADGQVVGNGGLHRVGQSPRRAHAMMIGLAVHSDWQGKGVGRALLEAMLDLADNWLPVTRLELTVFTDNERALALYRKLGFEIEGTHKAYALRAGRYEDTYAMARVKTKDGAAAPPANPGRDPTPV